MLDLKTKVTGVVSQKADIETSSDDYAKRFSGKVGEYFLSVQGKITLDLLKPWHKAKVLDVGGGHAQLAVPLVNNGFDVTIVGSDESCRTRLDKFLQPKSFEYLTCNLLNLPFDDNSFDIVISFRLLTHEDNWKLQISELCRVAKHSVIIEKKFEGNTRTYRNFSRKEVIEEFDKNNFIKPVFKPEFFLPMVIHKAIKNVTILKAIEKLFSILGFTKLFGSPVILRVAAKEVSNTAVI